MGVHFLAAVAQVTLAIATSEPCAFDTCHASIADCSCMDEGRKVCCNNVYENEDQKEISRNPKKNIIGQTFGVVGLGSIWRRSCWKMIATANFRASEITMQVYAYRGGNIICGDSKGLSTGLGSLKNT